MKSENYSKPLALTDVKMKDDFWGREQELVRTEVIPYQWEALNDRIPDAAPSYCMRNFKVAGRMMRKKRQQGAQYVAPAYTYRGFEALPEDPKNPDPDKFYGFVFQDSDFAKWIEAVGYSLANHPDAELEKTADEAIDIVCAAQAENGYLDTYYIINGMDRIFTNLQDHHELYCFGHLAEGAVAYYQATGKDKLLKAVERYADFIASKFGREEGKCKGYPGHEIAEMALARLYEVTGEKKYLELGSFFLDQRGRRPYYFDLEEKERAQYEGRTYKEPDEKPRFQYYQAHLPVREQSEAVGHAVRAVYLYSGMADAARLNQDEAMYAACQRLWDSIVNEKLYITGGIGGTCAGEAFSFPYDLPNDRAYSETCAAIGLAFFARRMLQIQAKAEYGDVMEQALYNTVLAGMALDGKSFFYVNPLEVYPEACKKDAQKRHVATVRQKWFGCACCPPNLARIVSSVGSYAYTQSEDTLYTHLYVGSEVHTRLGGRHVGLKVESSFPWEGEVKIRVCSQKEEAGETFKEALAFRIPGWCRSVQAEVRRSLKGEGAEAEATLLACLLARRAEMEGGKNGQDPSGRILVLDDSLQLTNWASREPVSAAGACKEGACGIDKESEAGLKLRVEEGYLYLNGLQNGDEIRLSFPMEIRCVKSNPRVRQDIGKVAFARGPVTYCMEEADNGRDLHLLRVDESKLFGRAERSNALGHEMRVLKIPGFRQMPGEGKEALYTDYTPPAEAETELTFVPYYAWNNRGEGEMSVWVRI